jgi:hypothetical protein
MRAHRTRACPQQKRASLRTGPKVVHVATGSTPRRCCFHSLRLPRANQTKRVKTPTLSSIDGSRHPRHARAHLAPTPLANRHPVEAAAQARYACSPPYTAMDPSNAATESLNPSFVFNPIKI